MQQKKNSMTDKGNDKLRTTPTSAPNHTIWDQCITDLQCRPGATWCDPKSYTPTPLEPKGEVGGKTPLLQQTSVAKTPAQPLSVIPGPPQPPTTAGHYERALWWGTTGLRKRLAGIGVGTTAADNGCFGCGGWLWREWGTVGEGPSFHSGNPPPPSHKPYPPSLWAPHCAPERSAREGGQTKAI